MVFDIQQQDVVAAVHHGPHIAGAFFVADCLALRRETYTMCVTANLSELMDLLPAACSVQFELGS
jgi:hypothetical protein